MSKHRRGDCDCSLEWCKPKDNGTCGTCGGWLPGRQDDTPWGRQGMTLTQMWAGKDESILLEQNGSGDQPRVSA